MCYLVCCAPGVKFWSHCHGPMSGVACLVDQDIDAVAAVDEVLTLPARYHKTSRCTLTSSNAIATSSVLDALPGLACKTQVFPAYPRPRPKVHKLSNARNSTTSSQLRCSYVHASSSLQASACPSSFTSTVSTLTVGDRSIQPSASSIAASGKLACIDGAWMSWSTSYSIDTTLPSAGFLKQASPNTRLGEAGDKR